MSRGPIQQTDGWVTGGLVLVPKFRLLLHCSVCVPCVWAPPRLDRLSKRRVGEKARALEFLVSHVCLRPMGIGVARVASWVMTAWAEAAIDTSHRAVSDAHRLHGVASASARNDLRVGDPGGLSGWGNQGCRNRCATRVPGLFDGSDREERRCSCSRGGRGLIAARLGARLSRLSIIGPEKPGRDLIRKVAFSSRLAHPPYHATILCTCRFRRVWAIYEW